MHEPNMHEPDRESGYLITLCFLLKMSSPMCHSHYYVHWTEWEIMESIFCMICVSQILYKSDLLEDIYTLTNNEQFLIIVVSRILCSFLELCKKQM